MESIKFKKFRVDNLIAWETHRGGWGYINDIIKSEFHVPDGTLFLSAVENVMMKGRPIVEPWVGFIHQVPRNNLKKFFDLERLLASSTWLESLKYCKGIYTISNYLKAYLESKGLPVPVNYIPYAVDFQFKAFDFNAFLLAPKRVVFIGEFMRNFQAFFDLKTEGYQKLLLDTEMFRRANIAPDSSVQVVDRLSDNDYDQLLSTSIVFLNLYDAPANTTVVECLARNTPILINKLPGVVDYLGDDYPFYYQDLEEASIKLNDIGLIEHTYRFLQQSKNKDKLHKDYFIKSIHRGSIYRSLPIPKSQKQPDFEQFDISVVITSYKRLYNMDNLLRCFCCQEFNGSFELIVWNNNPDCQSALDTLYEKYKDQLNIRLIHSSENYYCAMRLAIPHLMQSEYMLICDDDVLPGPKYVQTFSDKVKAYTSEAVLCARGHYFEDHELDERNPEGVWRSGSHLRFYDESKDETELHFFHADNCLIPKSVLLKVNAFEWDNLDFILVDDYWMSYIISNALSVPIRKIKLDAQMAFTQCADDKGIALFHNPIVKQARQKFYVYHMERGWPNSLRSKSQTASVTGNDTPKQADNDNGVVEVEGNACLPTGSKTVKYTSEYFESYDLSVVICTYTRLHNLQDILEGFRYQDCSESFEIIIWNNNYARMQAVNDLYTQYKDLLKLKVIHSSKNYFCLPRIALTSIARGTKMVFCDDDVIPKSNYLSHLMKKHEVFGSTAVVCVTGQSFLTNEMDENLPHLVWENGGVKLHKVDHDECLVNYFHANTCIITRALMKKASTYALPYPEAALVDDYWLSYILASELNTRFVKIKGDAIMSFTDDAMDEKISMYRNGHVRYQKVAFQLYHRKEKWLPALQTDESCSISK